MGAAYDRWNSPAWGYQSKPDARLDLLGVSSAAGMSADPSGVFGPWTGNIYYVSNSGSDTDLGTTPGTAFLTITQALTKVTDANHDVIVVLDYWGTSRAAETFPIALTTSHDNVTIIGVPYGNIGHNAIYPTVATTAAFTIIGTNGARLINLNIGGYDSGDYGIHFPSGTAWRVSIIGCHFGTSGTTGTGIRVDSDPPQLLVQGCDFHSGLTTAGIYVSNCTRGDFIGNSFHVNSGDYGIQFSTSQADFGKILNNTFMVPDAANGEAIYCSGVLAGGIEMIAGNVAVKSGTNSSNTWVYEPYWWGGAGAMGVGFANNTPDPTISYRRWLEQQFPEVGKIIFVNGGSDGPTDNNRCGLTPHMAKQTINGALSLMTADNYDTIVVMNYGSNARAVDFASGPITLTSSHSRGRIIGIDGHSTKWPTITVNATSANHAFEVQTGAGRFVIKNLEIGGAATKAGIHISSGQYPWGLVIDNCYFGVDTAIGGHGIEIDSGGDAPHMRVQNCTFYGTDNGGALTDDCIEINGNATRAIIRDNLFRVTAAKIGISIEAGAVGLTILRNKFSCDDADGSAIYLAATADNIFCAENMAAAGEDAALTNQIYYDAGSSNDWVANWTSDPTSTTTLWEVD
jgi:hypothetical protein